MKRINNKGFSLIELLVVIAIMAILAGVGVAGYSVYTKEADKAADEHLLGEINRVFAAACTEKGILITDLTATTAKIAVAEDGTVTFAGMEPAECEDSMVAAFGTEQKFKVFTGIYFDPIKHVFKAASVAYSNALNNVLANMGTEIDAVQNSAFAGIGANALLGQVNDVSNLATDLIYSGSTLTNVVLNDEYINNLASRLGKDPDALKTEINTMLAADPNAAAQYLANSTVLNVAGTMNSATFNEAEALNMLETSNWGALGSTLNTDPETGLAQAAMLYGLYTAYDPEAASALTVTGDVTALLALKDNDGFTAYLSQVNTEGSQAYKDYQGYKSAMDIINESASDKDVAAQVLENGYSDPELLALLQQVMAS